MHPILCSSACSVNNHCLPDTSYGLWLCLHRNHKVTAATRVQGGERTMHVMLSATTGDNTPTLQHHLCGQTPQRWHTQAPRCWYMLKGRRQLSTPRNLTLKQPSGSKQTPHSGITYMHRPNTCIWCSRRICVHARPSCHAPSGGDEFNTLHGWN